MKRSNGSSMKQNFKVIIIGSGFGGQLAALNLSKEGINDFVILERRKFMGGTWSQNVYPGAAVDVPSPLYALASEPYDWSQFYAERHELNAYTNFIIQKPKLDKKTITESNVNKIEWDQDSNLWKIHVDGRSPYDAIAEKYQARREEHRQIFADFYKQDILDSRLQEISVPALLIWGEEDRLIHVSSAELWQTHIQNIQVHIFSGIGHMPMLEAPQRTAQIYRSFIEQSE